jgi:CheY-like chemotaxis protein
MPSMNGYELLERIRGVYPQYRNLPFIFLTALTEAADKQAVSGLRPTAYLEKPLDFDQLRATIDKALKSSF